MKETKSTLSVKSKAGTGKTAPSKIKVDHFPVAGFGASAGGLEAFTELLRHLDPHLGIAYVLIMHLSPNHKSSLREILQTKTKMKVHTVKDRMKVKPDNVYVIPPNALMSLVDGHLKLAPRGSALSAGNFAVDYFFTTLASIYKNNSIGIILSGNATDGTLGLKAIKAEGGITFAQDDTAKFTGMPRNAYDSGYADFMLSPEGIAKELAHLVKNPYTVLPSDTIEEKHKAHLDNELPVLKKILSIVKDKSGVDFFSDYKQAMIYRRVVRRVVLNKCKGLNDYFSILEGNEKEVHDLYNDFLINVTHFFRDPDFFKTLERVIFPSIIHQRISTDPIRIWVAGCSTGEEAYSVAISLKEFLEKKGGDLNFQIFASDLDSNAIEKARLGIYPLSALQSVPKHFLKRYFRSVDGHYQIEKTIRELCIFSQHNLLKDPPFSRMDLISCQNVLIYLEPNPQQRVLKTFHYALRPSGFLFLGKSESIGGSHEFFEPLDKKIPLYARKNTKAPPLEYSHSQIELVPSNHPSHVDRMVTVDIEKDISKILLTRYVSPSIVLDETLNIIQFFGITTPYLGPVLGKASLNILKMIREDLIIDLRALLHQVRKSGKPALKEGIRISSKKAKQEITLEVIPRKIENKLFFLVVFRETPPVIPEKSRKGKKPGKITGHQAQIISKLEEELVRSREVIRTTNEEYETTYEELQAHNEEILSSNEELQSVNEELETSKEELQSANEELTTINEELQKRNVELKQSQSYAKAIVDTVNSPFLVLTSNLQVKTANNSFYRTFKLTAEETVGRFIYDLGGHAWDIPAFRGNLNELLSKKSNYLEFELKHFFPGLGELAFIINAYRLTDEDITKEFLILLAFINISEVTRTNNELKQLNQHLVEFTFGASHDLQEPLRKIETFANFLATYEHTDSYIKKYVGKINIAAERMSTLLKGVLAYSVLLKNGENIFRPVDLNTTVRNVVSDLDLVIEEKSAVLNIGPLPTVEAEPTLMYQLFYNLIKNALIFNNGKPIVSITAEQASPGDYDKHHLKKEKRYVSICIKDNGVGFQQQYADRIFSIFKRLDPMQGATGSGMGLAICKKIVEDHGGAIFAVGEENAGATFSILLPTP